MLPTEALGLLLDALHGEFILDHEDDAPRLVGQAGQLSTADWCSAGLCWQVYVRLDAMFPAARFPTVDTTPGGFTAPLAARWHVGVFRCVAGLDDGGYPPDAAEQTADTALLLDDAHRIRCALEAISLPKAHRLLGTWTPLGPFGNCAGGYWPWTVRL